MSTGTRISQPPGQSTPRAHRRRMMECKSALAEAKGDLAEAEVVCASAALRRPARRLRATTTGLVGTYIHAGGQLGVMVEVNCECDFVARTDDFQELVHDIAMHIAAPDPQFVRKEDVTPEAFGEGKGNPARPAPQGKPERWSTRSSKAAWPSSTKRSACSNSRS